MRRIRNQKINSTNPSLMFAAGVEQIISETLSRPSQYPYQTPSESQTFRDSQTSGENLFKLLFRQFSY